MVRRYASVPRVAGALACIVLAAAGCDDTTAPAGLQGTFVLASVGGDPLPAHTISGGPSASPETIRADTITFLGPGPRGLPRIAHRAWYDLEGGGERLAAYEDEYSLDGGRVLFVPPPCPPDADCFYARRFGRFENGDLVVTFDEPRFRTQVFRPR